MKGIRAEMMPFLLMTSPSDVRNLTHLPLQPGKKMFRSFLLAGGFFPIDFSDLTLVEVEENVRFLERSPMGSMKFWQHERIIIPKNGYVILEDHLQFQPRFATAAIKWITQKFFEHRHRQLRKHFNK